MKKIIIIFTSVIILLWFIFIKDKPVVFGPGIFAPNDPIQQVITNPKKFMFKGTEVIPLATFDITAKVLGKEKYYFDSLSELSPIDIVLGWGKMSDEVILEKVHISQSNRWYYWQVASYPIPRIEITTHSANVHLIPATDAIESQLNKVQEGTIVNFVGKLVLIKGNNWQWKSSLTREDTGAGGCEVMFVEQVR